MADSGRPVDPFAPGLLWRLPEPPGKVVIVRTSRIGDFICATPAFRALRTALPGSEISLVGLPFVRELVERSPHLDRFIPFPGFPGMAEQFFDARKATRFFARMQAEEFDLAIQLNGSGVYSNPFTLMLGARATAGFVREGDWPGRLDAALPFPEKGHQVRRPLALATFLGAEHRGEETEFPLLPEDHREADRLLAGASPPLVGLHPAARDASKCWPSERFGRLGAYLRQQCMGTVVVVGGPDDALLGEQVAAAAGAPCLNLVGRTSLPSLGAIISRLALLVTNDSGPAHIGYALGVPTLTLFGETDPSEWGPLDGRRHRVLRGCSPEGQPDVQGIAVEQAMRAAEELLITNMPGLLTDASWWSSP